MRNTVDFGAAQQRRRSSDSNDISSSNNNNNNTNNNNDPLRVVGIEMLDMTTTNTSSSSSLATANVQAFTKETILTPVVWCILVAETGERFAYYGFRAILVLYFVQDLQYEESSAIARYAVNTSLAYLSPMFGAILADSLLGRYRTILYFSILYIVGLAILTSAAWLQWGDLNLKRGLTSLGLFLVCMGTGGIKPCVSAFGADQVAISSTSSFSILPTDGGMHKDSSGDLVQDVVVVVADEASQQRVRTFFALFYFCINVGAVVSIAVVPIMRGYAGFGAAFSLSLWFMILAIVLFASKRNVYRHLVPGQDGTSLLTMLLLVWWLFRQNLWQQDSFVRQWIPVLKPGPCPGSFGGYRRVATSDASAAISVGPTSETALGGGEGEHWRRCHKQQLSDAAQVLHVLPIFASLPIFWCLYDQQSSVWTLQATKMRLHGLQPEQLNVVNPVEIMLLLPLFENIIYPLLQKAGWHISPIRRMSWGMLFAAMSFTLSGLVESWIQHSSKSTVSVFWQMPQITILAIAEIFVSVTGLEFAYSCAPDRVKALIMALFLLTTAVGNMFSSVLYSTVFASMDRAVVMHACAMLMMLNLGGFYFLSRWWEQTNAGHLMTSLSHYAEEEVELNEPRSSISGTKEESQSTGALNNGKA